MDEFEGLILEVGDEVERGSVGRFNVGACPICYPPPWIPVSKLPKFARTATCELARTEANTFLVNIGCGVKKTRKFGTLFYLHADTE